MSIRFHLDEHIRLAIAAGLRRRKIDVTTSVGTGLVGADDRAQLAFATSVGRVLVTQDADFLRLHAEGVEHAGIVYCCQNSITTGEMLGRLMLIHDVLSPQEMANRVEFL